MDQEYERKKEILSKYISLQHSIIGYTEELAKWGTIGTKINQTYKESIGTGANTSKTEIAGTNLAEIKKNIENDISKCTVEREAIKNAIDSVTKGRYREVLTLRYISGLTLRRMTEILQKDERNLKRVLKEAVLSVEI